MGFINCYNMYKGLILGIFFTSFTFVQKTDITLYIIGDSTAANKLPTAFPETGWGMELQPFFAENVKVDNRAVNGRSTKSFIYENRWEAVLANLKADDFVFIEFGHNDEKLEKPEVGTSLEEYKSNLIKYVTETREKKANPILLTPIARRNFVNGALVGTHKGYPDVVRKLADSLKVPLIDMERKTEKLLTKLGDEPSKKLFNYVDSGHVNYPNGKKDDTHLSPEGAKSLVKLVVDGIKETKIGLVKYLKK